MKKILIIILNIFLFTISVSFAEVNEIFINCDCKSSSFWDYFANIIAAVNLIFIVWFYFNDLANKKIDAKKNYMFFWYQNYGLVEAMKYLNIHIDLCNKLILQFKEFCISERDSDKRSEFIKNEIIPEFTPSNNITKNRIDMVISAIGVRNKSDQFRESFRKIQDLFTEELGKLEPDFKKMTDEIENVKIEIMNGLYILGTEEFLEEDNKKMRNKK